MINVNDVISKWHETNKKTRGQFSTLIKEFSKENKRVVVEYSYIYHANGYSVDDYKDYSLELGVQQMAKDVCSFLETNVENYYYILRGDCIIGIHKDVTSCTDRLGQMR